MKFTLASLVLGLALIAGTAKAEMYQTSFQQPFMQNQFMPVNTGYVDPMHGGSFTVQEQFRVQIPYQQQCGMGQIPGYYGGCQQQFMPYQGCGSYYGFPSAGCGGGCGATPYYANNMMYGGCGGGCQQPIQQPCYHRHCGGNRGSSWFVNIATPWFATGFGSSSFGR